MVRYANQKGMGKGDKGKNFGYSKGAAVAPYTVPPPVRAEAMGFSPPPQAAAFSSAPAPAPAVGGFSPPPAIAEASIAGGGGFGGGFAEMIFSRKPHSSVLGDR